MNPFDHIDRHFCATQEHVFQLREVGTVIQFSREEFCQCDLPEIENRLRFELRAWVVAEDAQPVIIQYPSDWWQHLKQRWFPRWALKRWPVKMTRHEITASMLFPYFKPKIPECGQPVFKIAVKKALLTSRL